MDEARSCSAAVGGRGGFESGAGGCCCCCCCCDGFVGGGERAETRAAEERPDAGVEALPAAPPPSASLLAPLLLGRTESRDGMASLDPLDPPSERERSSAEERRCCGLVRGGGGLGGACAEFPRLRLVAATSSSTIATRLPDLAPAVCCCSIAISCSSGRDDEPLGPSETKRCDPGAPEPGTKGSFGCPPSRCSASASFLPRVCCHQCAFLGAPAVTAGSC